MQHTAGATGDVCEHPADGDIDVLQLGEGEFRQAVVMLKNPDQLSDRLRGANARFQLRRDRGDQGCVVRCPGWDGGSLHHQVVDQADTVAPGDGEGLVFAVSIECGPGKLRRLVRPTVSRPPWRMTKWPPDPATGSASASAATKPLLSRCRDEAQEPAGLVDQKLVEFCYHRFLGAAQRVYSLLEDTGEGLVPVAPAKFDF